MCGFIVPFAGRRRQVFKSEGSQTLKEDARDVSAHLIVGVFFSIIDLSLRALKT